MPLTGRKANVKVTAVTPTSSTGVAATRSTGTGTATGRVRINNAAQRHLDPDGSQVLLLNSTVVSSTNYDLNYVQGIFQWKTGDPSTGTYTADIEYLTASSLSQAREWTLTPESDMFDTTVFGSSGWKRFQPNLNGVTATIGRFWDDSTFIDYITTETRFITEFIINSSANWRYEAFCYIANDQINTSVDALVSETINLNIDGQLYFTT